MDLSRRTKHGDRSRASEERSGKNTVVEEGIRLLKRAARKEPPRKSRKLSSEPKSQRVEKAKSERIVAQHDLQKSDARKEAVKRKARLTGAKLAQRPCHRAHPIGPRGRPYPVSKDAAAKQIGLPTRAGLHTS